LPFAEALLRLKLVDVVHPHIELFCGQIETNNEDLERLVRYRLL
jgi:hypothetical protein